MNISWIHGDIKYDKIFDPIVQYECHAIKVSNTGHCQLFFARVARFSRVFLGSRNYKFSIRLLLCSTIYCLHNVFFVACLVYKKLHRFGSFLKSPLFWRERLDNLHLRTKVFEEFFSDFFCIHHILQMIQLCAVAFHLFFYFRKSNFVKVHAKFFK